MVTEIELLIGLITAATMLAATIGGLMIKFIQFKQKITGKVSKYDDEVVWIAEQLEQTDRWVLENQDYINKLLATVTNLSPDAKRLLQEKGIDIIKATNEINRIREELDRLRQLRLSTIGAKTSIPTRVD